MKVTQIERGKNQEQQLNPEEWSLEQHKQRQENERRGGGAVDDRKLDGPNVPST